MQLSAFAQNIAPYRAYLGPALDATVALNGLLELSYQKLAKTLPG
jgi:hypothetical protein